MGEIITVLNHNSGTDAYPTVLSDVLKGILRSTRSIRTPTRNCAGTLSQALVPILTRKIRAEILDHSGWKELLRSNNETSDNGDIGSELHGTSGAEYVEGKRSGETRGDYVARQRRAMVSRLNQGVAVDEVRQVQQNNFDRTTLIILEEDVAEKTHLDKRESNQKKRKQKMEFLGTLEKKRKLGVLADVGEDTAITVLFFYRALFLSLSDEDWECREGSLLCIGHVAAAIVQACHLPQSPTTPGAYVSLKAVSSTSEASENLSFGWKAVIESIISRCFGIMVMERFADYKMDIVLSPVHESLACTLDVVVSLLPIVDIKSSIDRACDIFTQNKTWYGRYGAALFLLKFSRNGRTSNTFEAKIFECAFEGLQDPSGDVSSIAAKIIAARTNEPRAFANIDPVLLQSRLWGAMDKTNEFCSSPADLLWCLRLSLNACRGNSDHTCFGQLDSMGRVTLFLLHSLREVRLAALLVFKDFFADLEKADKSPDHARKRILNFFNGSKCLQIIFEIKVLEEYNTKVLNLASEVFDLAVSCVPENSPPSAVCSIREWMELAATPNGHTFNRRLFETSKHDESSLAAGSSGRIETAIVSFESINARLEKVSCPGTRIIISESVAIVLSRLPVSLDSAEISFISTMLTGTSGLAIAAAAQVVQSITKTSILGHFLPLLQKIIKGRKKGNGIRYTETVSLRKRIHHECQQLGRLHDSMGAANGSAFNHRDLVASLYRATEIESAYKLVEESCSSWATHADTAELKEESVQIAISRIHGSLSIWFDANRQIDVEASACLSAAIAALIDSHVTRLPKKAGVIILPLLMAVKTVANLALRTLVARALAKILLYCSDITLKKIVGNACLYIGNGDRDSSSSKIAYEGGRLILASLSGEREFFPGKVAPILWDIIEHSTDGSGREVLPQLDYGGAMKLMSEFLSLDGYTEQRDLKIRIERTFSQVGQTCCLPASVALGTLSSLGTEYFDVVLNLTIGGLLCSRHAPLFCLQTLLSVTKKNSLNSTLPYVTLALPYIIKGLTDQHTETKSVAYELFSWAVPLLSFEKSTHCPMHWNADWRTLRDQNRIVLSELFGSSSSAGSLVEFSSSVFKNIDLRSYQKEGISWLVAMQRVGLHGLLCDDMGLGKTVQSLLALAISVTKSSSTFPSLVICPTSVVFHWSKEIETYCADVLTPVPTSSRNKSSWESFKNDPRAVYIMSHRLFRENASALSSMVPKWNYVILDEAHLVGWKTSCTFSTIRELKSLNRIALTGTPLQNNIMEIYQIFEFLIPGFLGEETEFKSKYFKPINMIALAPANSTVTCAQQESYVMAMDALQKKISPFLKRRLKSEVLQELPEKIIQDRVCTMPDWQRRIYDTLAKTGETQETLAYQQKMRLACTHPCLLLPGGRLVMGAHNEMVAKFKGLIEVLLECGIENREGEMPHRCVLFVQFKKTLNILDKVFFPEQFPKLKYKMLEGSMSLSARQRAINAFNSEKDITVMIATTKVGGVGIDLTGADTVIFVEHDWNPQNDMQAMDRVHRLGQKSVTNVYRLLCHSTIETRIMNLQAFKLKLAKALIKPSGEDTTSLSDAFSSN